MNSCFSVDLYVHVSPTAQHGDSE